MIEFNNVTAVYNNGSGIFDITFEVQKSELVFLMGPTGSGKSTVLKTIYKELGINKGEIHINGKSISSLNKNSTCFLRRDVGMIFQDFRLLDDRNVYNNVALPLLIANYSKKDISDKVFDILNVVGLKNKHKRYPGELSGGEQQRVSIARAIVKDPKIVLADEPTGNLDPNISMEILELLEMVSDNGASVIMCTHNYPLIKYKKRRFLELKDGRLQ